MVKAGQKYVGKHRQEADYYAELFDLCAHADTKSSTGGTGKLIVSGRLTVMNPARLMNSRWVVLKRRIGARRRNIAIGRVIFDVLLKNRN